MPRAWWPKGWADRFADPVCELKKALYGHPHAGDYWFEHLEKELTKLGFKAIEGWPSVYCRNPGTESAEVIIVYVDDLLAVGSDSIRKTLDVLRKTVKMEDPSPLSKYLGCFHKFSRIKDVTTVTFDMSDYLTSAAKVYFEETGRKPATSAMTPYAPEVPLQDLEAMLAKPGEQKERAASYLMRLMYAARMAFPHIAVGVSRLARRISKWSVDDDRRLHRLMSYVYYHAEDHLTGELASSDIGNLRLVAWPDADLAGDPSTTKSTSGFFLELQGLHGRGFPLSWGSRRQTATATCTAEAEMISLSSCLKTELIPMQSLLQEILNVPIPAFVEEDNAATIIAATKGYSPSMRDLRRTHRTSIGSVHDIISERPEDRMPNEGSITLEKAATADHRGDFFTKYLTPKDYVRALSMLRVVSKHSHS